MQIGLPRERPKPAASVAPDVGAAALSPMYVSRRPLPPRVSGRHRCPVGGLPAQTVANFRKECECPVPPVQWRAPASGRGL
jgi:hypothetical protein